MLLFVVVGSFWLEIIFKVGVLRRIKRATLSIAPPATAFILWDIYATSRSHWYFDKNQVLGLFGVAGIPLEEFLFFLVVPLAALMTIEAVRHVKSDWTFGDESR
jgi:lycopene cyclase domain-containing protein